MSAARVELHEAWPPAAEVRDAWRALALARENPFVTPEWFGAWAAAHPEERPFVLVVYEPGGTVQAVLPLVLARRGPLRTLQFAGAAFGDWFVPLCAPGGERWAAAALAPALHGHAGRWHVLALDRFDADPAWLAGLREGWPGRGPSVARLAEEDLLSHIEFPPEGWEGYLAAMRKKSRREIARMRRRLEEGHDVRFRPAGDEGEADRDIDAMFRFQDARWAQEGGSQALTGNAPAFHRGMARGALRQGWLRLWSLDVDGETIAVAYGWKLGARAFAYMQGYDVARRDLGGGTLLLAHEIEAAAGEGARVFDMLRGDEPHKQRLQTGNRPVPSFVVTRRGHPAGAALAAVRGARALVKRLPPGVRDPLVERYRRVRR